MRQLGGLCVASFIVTLVSFASFGSQTELLSLTGLRLQSTAPDRSKTGQFIASFDLKTWGVKVLAVCHIPAGWTITAGKNANPEGVLSGNAGEGVAFIDAGTLKQLDDLFLVDVDGYHADDLGDCSKDCTPATFSGVLYEGTYGVETPDIRIRLRSLNIRLTPATSCPSLQ